MATPNDPIFSVGNRVHFNVGADQTSVYTVEKVDYLPTVIAPEVKRYVYNLARGGIPYPAIPEASLTLQA